MCNRIQLRYLEVCDIHTPLLIPLLTMVCCPTLVYHLAACPSVSITRGKGALPSFNPLPHCVLRSRMAHHCLLVSGSTVTALTVLQNHVKSLLISKGKVVVMIVTVTMRHCVHGRGKTYWCQVYTMSRDEIFQELTYNKSISKIHKKEIYVFLRALHSACML